MTTNIYFLEPAVDAGKRARKDGLEDRTEFICQHGQRVLASSPQLHGEKTIELKAYSANSVQLFANMLMGAAKASYTEQDFSAVIEIAATVGLMQLRDQLTCCRLVTNLLAEETLDEECIIGYQVDMQALDLGETQNVYRAVRASICLWNDSSAKAAELLVPEKWPKSLAMLTLFARAKLSAGECELGEELLEEACEQQFGPALHFRALQLLAHKEENTALEKFRQAAASGAKMGGKGCYLLGWENFKNSYFASAADWFQRGADLGEARCQANFSTLLYQGKGIERSVAQSLFWAEKAADGGSKNAARSFGISLFKGKDCEKDYAKARIYLAKAGDDKDCLYYLGLCYLDGLGGQADTDKAKQLLESAANKGSKPAKNKLANL